jgi:hypothetical protein
MYSEIEKLYQKNPLFRSERDREARALSLPSMNSLSRREEKNRFGP